MRSWRSRKRREHARLYGAFFHSGFLLRRCSEFPARRDFPTLHSALLKLKIADGARGRTPTVVSSSSTESQGSVEAKRVLAWSQSQRRGVTCD